MGGSESKPNPTEPDAEGYQTTLINVGMTCEGCAGAVKRILNKVDGIDEVTTDVAAKTVLVKSKVREGAGLGAKDEGGAGRGGEGENRREYSPPPF